MLQWCMGRIHLQSSSPETNARHQRASSYCRQKCLRLAMRERGRNFKEENSFHESYDLLHRPRPVFKTVMWLATDWWLYEGMLSMHPWGLWWNAAVVTHSTATLPTPLALSTHSHPSPHSTHPIYVRTHLPPHSHTHTLIHPHSTHALRHIPEVRNTDFEVIVSRARFPYKL